ncbi:hypothetical protein DF153_18115 [Burkholderia cenocepacia]|nr:hypothetical protein DF152_19580 [Burkholderia cenocepacia]RQU23445.1 hypothetical protein DF153_18115 [Burkholderia cenocepacia]
MSSKVEEIVASIVNSDDAAEAYEIYRIGAPFLGDYKFIFASGTGSPPGFAVNRMFKNGAAVRSLFGSDRVLMLDAKTAKEMEGGRSIFPIDYSISLDTNAMSYLEPYITGRSGGGIPSDFGDVFNFIAQPEVSIDPIPYFSENLLDLSRGKSPDSVFSNIRAYEVLRTIDVDRLNNMGEIRSTINDAELDSRAQNLVSKILFSLSDKAALDDLNHKHGFTYACLLKMVEIQLKTTQAPLESKLERFAEFCHSELSVMSIREMAIAKSYFIRGQKFGFFGKIQKNKDGVLDLLKNMAWDLWHVRQLEQSLARRPQNAARYYFPALLTFDKNLIEVMDIYPLKSFAYSIKNYCPLPVFDGDPYLILGADERHGERVFEKYYSAASRAERQARRDTTFDKMRRIVEELEQAVLVITAPKPSDSK